MGPNLTIPGPGLFTCLNFCSVGTRKNIAKNFQESWSALLKSLNNFVFLPHVQFISSWIGLLFWSDAFAHFPCRQTQIQSIPISSIGIWAFQIGTRGRPRTWSIVRTQTHGLLKNWEQNILGYATFHLTTGRGNSQSPICTNRPTTNLKAHKVSLSRNF